MVEIKCSNLTPNGKPLHASLTSEEEKYRLIYSKSKVYVHPTAYARDNIPGFVVLVKRVCMIFTRRIIFTETFT